jgi:hypothetical protein
MIIKTKSYEKAYAINFVLVVLISMLAGLAFIIFFSLSGLGVGVLTTGAFFLIGGLVSLADSMGEDYDIDFRKDHYPKIKFIIYQNNEGKFILYRRMLLVLIEINTFNNIEDAIQVSLKKRHKNEQWHNKQKQEWKLRRYMNKKKKITTI